MELERERSNDTEISSAPSQCPEQIGILSRIRSLDTAIGKNDFGVDKVVNRQAIFRREIAVAAPERESSNSRRRDDSADGRQSNAVRDTVDVASCRAALRSCRARRVIDLNALHC